VNYLRNTPLSEYGADITLDVPLHVDHDFEVDQDGVSHLVTFIYVGDNEDDVTETRVDLEGVVSDLCEFYGDEQGYNQLYLVAHEFHRLAEKLREKAGYIEDSDRAVGDLFHLPDD